ncbi:MAG: TrgA family protein [Pseudomonadota bacterium]
MTPMPTGGKFIGALGFAALTFLVTSLILALLPEGTQARLFAPINVAFGLIMGWRILGARAGEGLVRSIGYGLQTLFAITFWCILVWAGWEMLQNSVRLRYDGPIEALQAMAGLMVEYTALIATTEVVTTAVIGSIFVSWLTEFFSARWS